MEYTKQHNRYVFFYKEIREIGPTFLGIQTKDVENLKKNIKAVGIDF